MPKATDIKPTFVPQPTQEGLHDKEQAERLRQQNLKKTHEDAARAVQRAGFQRLGASKKKDLLDIGDSSHAPIPLPDEDMDREAGSWERLQAAQEELVACETRLAGLAADERGDGARAASGLLRSTFMPTEEGMARLEALSRAAAPSVDAGAEAMSSSVERLFGVRLDPDLPAGERVLAVGLLVAGEAGAVRVDKGRINTHVLLEGVQKVAQRSNQAVGEAQKMSKGISKELNLQRTVIFKR